MGYTAVKGGAEAIAAAERLIQQVETGKGEALLETTQVRHQLASAVDKVIGEGGLYAPELAALAVKQCEGDLFEAAFMLRAYRSTLPRLGYSLPCRGADMLVTRRISSAFRDIPGGQLLGRTRDYTQRLLDVDRSAAGASDTVVNFGISSETTPNGSTNGSTQDDSDAAWDGRLPKVTEVMRAMGVMAALPDRSTDPEPDDITRDPLRFPVRRPAWLQSLARGETGALVCLAYSSLRGFGGPNGHGTIAELRVGDLPLRVVHPLTGRPVTVGHFRATEVEMVGRGHRKSETVEAGLPSYHLSYGLVFGQNERKAISMGILDGSLQASASEDGPPSPANDQEMILYHIDSIESNGFVEHLKLPHFVTFGSNLQILLEQRARLSNSNGTASGSAGKTSSDLVASGSQVRGEVNADDND